MIIDTHAHLTDTEFGGATEIIKNMAEDNLSAIITVGYDLESSLAGTEIAKNNKNIFAAVGVHPSNTHELPDCWEDELLRLAALDKVVAIGEIGLDYHYDDTDKFKQAEALVKQLDIVEKTNLPVIFHVRDAYADMLDIVKPRLGKIKAGGVMHCFSGSKETAKAWVDMGFYISFSGSITFKNAVKFPEIISSLPHDRILTETDCPYLAPHPHRGKTNYPKYANITAAKIAEILGESISDVEKLLTKNSFECFPLLKKGNN